MSSESDWSRVGDGTNEKAHNENVVTDEDVVTDTTKNPSGLLLRELPEYQLFYYGDDSEVQLLKFPSGPLSICSDIEAADIEADFEASDGEEDDTDEDQNNYKVLLSSIGKIEARKKTIIVFTRLTILILLFVVAGLSTALLRISHSEIRGIEDYVSKSPDIFEVVKYGNTDITVAHAEPDFLEMILANYLRCVMTMLRAGNGIAKSWKEFLMAGVNFVIKKQK